MMFAPAAYPAGFKIIIFHYNEEYIHTNISAQFIHKYAYVNLNIFTVKHLVQAMPINEIKLQLENNKK